MAAILVPFESHHRIGYCLNVVTLANPQVTPGQILDFVCTPENGCQGRWSIGYHTTVYFEDAATAMMVKLRFG